MKVYTAPKIDYTEYGHPVSFASSFGLPWLLKQRAEVGLGKALFYQLEAVNI